MLIIMDIATCLAALGVLRIIFCSFTGSPADVLLVGYYL